MKLSQYTSMFHPVQLIDEVKKRPGLYKADRPADREEKLALWKEVGAAIYHDWASYNKATAYDKVLQLQRKWRSLRDAYNREIRARRSGIRINRRVYRYFKRMSYLGGYEGSISEDDMDEDTVLEGTGGHEEDEVHEEPVPVKKTKRKKRKREPSEEEQQAPEEMEIPMFPVEINETDSDSDKLFMLSFLPEMRQLPTNIKMWVRAQIANVMQEAVSCHYSNTFPGPSGSDKNGGIEVKVQRDTD